MVEDPLVALAARVGAQLKSAGVRLVTAESCTGGWVAASVTAVAGSSAWFERGFVTYSNASKTELLGVDVALLAAHGAVSEPVARAMAQGAIARSHADYAVAITGIAGPDGGTQDKPVGTVCFAWAGPGGALRSVTRHLPGDRQAVRRQSVVEALEGVSGELGRAQ